MSSDHRKILEMLAEGKISTDDAERLLGKIGSRRSDNGSDDHGAPEGAPGGGALKYLRVLVDSDKGDKVNVRVPIALVRTGLMLTTLIPAAASEELHKKGIDLSGLSGLDGDELIEALRDLHVDVDSANGDTVRVFCE